MIAVIAAVTAVVVLGGAGVTVVLLNRPQPTGEEAVRAYFEQLALGDADAALTHVLPPETGDYRSNQPLLTDAAIAGGDIRPAGLQVIARRQTTLPDGDIRERVSVTYTVGQSTLRQTILTRQTERGEPFLLEEPFFRLRVTGQEGRDYSINGVPVDALQNEQLIAFPGRYTAAIEGNALFAQETVDADGRATDELPALFQIEFERALASGAEEAVQAAANAHLDGCLQDHSMTPFTVNPSGVPTSCPFYLTASAEVSVDWSFGRYPDVTVSLSTSGPERVVFFSEVTGVVRYDVPPAFVDSEFEFAFGGEAFVDDGVVKVETFYDRDSTA
jgi:hypothetical protein